MRGFVGEVISLSTDLTEIQIELGAAIDAVSGEIPGRRVTTSVVGKVADLMKFVFPQDPSHSVSAMRRVDENADVEFWTKRSCAAARFAVVGQTVPMLFCNRHEWGTDVSGQQLGENGGVWYSPRLIGLYPKGLLANLLYLISSGEVKGMDIEKRVLRV